MRFTKRHFAGAASLVAIAAVAMVGGATGMGESNSSSAPKQAAKKPTKPARVPAAADVNKLMQKAAKKNDGNPTTDDGKKLSAKAGGCTSSSAIQACLHFAPIKKKNELTNIEVSAKSQKSYSAMSVAVQKYGEPVSWPKICGGGRVSRCAHGFLGRGRYRTYASYWNGSVWSYPSVTSWIYV